MACDPEVLSISASKLLGIPENLRWQVIISLLCQIRDNTIGAAANNNIAGDTQAPDAGDIPPNPLAAALYYFTDAGGIGNQSLWQWNIAAQNWTQLI